MGLKENVNNTQFGDTDIDVQVPDVNLSNLSGKDSDNAAKVQANKQPPIKSPQREVAPQPVQPENQSTQNQWKDIYDYIGGSESFHTDLPYNEFVQKYSSDEDRKNNLFSSISSDALKNGIKSPFQSNNINDFKSNEASILKTSGESIFGSTMPSDAITDKDEADNAAVAANPIGSVNNIVRDPISDDGLHSESIANEQSTDVLARQASPVDGLSVNVSSADLGAPTIDNDDNLFVDLFSDANATGVDKYDVANSLMVDINTGQPIDLRDGKDIKSQEDVDREMQRLRMTDDAAKTYIDGYFNKVRDKIADGGIDFQDVVDGLSGTGLTSIGADKKLFATLHFNPQLKAYYENSLASLKSTASNVVQVRKNVENRDNILTDFNTVKLDNDKFSKVIQDKFGGTSIEEVFLLNNKYYNSFVNSYSSKGFDPKDVKNAMDYHIQNYIYDKSSENKDNWRNKVRMTLSSDLSPEEKKSEFYIKYTEMMDMEGLKYYNVDQKEAAILNVEINALYRTKKEGLNTGSWSLIEEKELQDKIKNRDLLRDTKILYSSETGEIIEKGEENEVDVSYGENIKKFESIYKDTDLDELYKRREQLFFQLNWMENNVTNNHTYSSSSSSTSTSWSPDEYVTIRYNDGKSEKRNIKSFLKDDEEAGFVGNKDKTLQVAMPYTYNMVKDIRTELTALNNLILFNQDPSEIDRTSLGGQTLKAFNEYLGGEDETHYENEAKHQINTLKSAGFNLTKAQEDRLIDNNWQTVGNAVGGSLPAMGEIIFWTAVAKNIGGAAGAIGNLGKVITGLSRGNKTVESILTTTNQFMKSNGIYQAVNTGMVYEMSGQGFSTGVGESAGQGMAEKLFSSKIKKNAWSQFALRILGGATGETIEEYSGEFLTNLTESGFDIQKSMDKTAGDNPLEKLLVTYAVGLMFSAPTSAVRTIDAIKTRKWIEKNKSSFPDQSKVDEVLDINNEDGRFEARGKALVASEINMDVVFRYNSLSKKNVDDLTFEENLEISRFEAGVQEAGELLSDEVKNAVNNINPELLSSEVVDSELDPEVSTKEGAEFDLTSEDTKGKKAVSAVVDEAQDVGDSDETTGVDEKIDIDGGTKKTKDTKGEKPDVDTDGKEQSVDKEIRKGTDKGEPSKQDSKRNLTKDENQKVQGVVGDELQILKDELGMSKSRASSAKQVQRAYNKNKDSDTNVFMKAVDRAKGDIEAGITDIDAGIKSDVKVYADVNNDIKKGEALLKSGNIIEGEAMLESARAKSFNLKNESDKTSINDRIDNFIKISKSEKVDVSKVKTKSEKDIELSATKSAESEQKLNNLRGDIVGTEVSASASTPTGRKTFTSGEVLKLDRVGTAGSEYEALIKRDDKRAIKAKYNSETGEYSFIPQDKADEKSNMSNFKATTERGKSGAKKEVRTNRVSELSNEVTSLSEAAGMTSKRGATKGKPKSAIQKLLAKIAYVESEGSTKEYIDKFNSELNGLIKDDASIESLKLKKKLQNLMTSAKSDDGTKPPTEPTTKVKAKKVKTTDNANIDKANQVLFDAKTNLKDIPTAELGKSTKINGKFFPIHTKELLDKGDITPQEYAELQEDYKKLWSDRRILDEKAISVGEKAVGDESFNGFDESFQTQPRGIGSNSVDSTGRISPRIVSKAESNKFSIKKVFGRLLKSDDTPTPMEMIKRLAASTETRLFQKSTEGSKSPRWVGKFTKSANAVTLRKRRDVDTFIHEIGHKVSFKYDLGDAVSDGSYDSELSKLWDNGSVPPKSVKTDSGKMNYKRNEGLAELIRAYSINPDATKSAFPNLYELVDLEIPISVKAELDKFGLDYSVLSNMTRGNYRKLLSMSYVTQSEVTEHGNIESSFRKRLARDTSQIFTSMFSKKGEGFSIGFWSNLNMAVFEKSGALKNAVDFAKSKGVEMKNSSNPYYLIRLMSNYQRNRLKNLIERGLADDKGNRVITKSGDLMNYGWLYGTLDTSSAARLDSDIELVESMLVAENLEWRRNENGGIDVTGAGFGLISEQKIIKEVLNELDILKNENPSRHKAIKEAANRYREFALQTVKYLKDTGRITEEHYNDISKNQDNYVALRAAMEEISNGGFDKFRSSSIKSVMDLKARGKGSDVKRDNPYSNLTAVLMESYYEGDRNNAVRSYVDMLNDVEGEVRSSSNKVDGDVELKYFENGSPKKVYISSDLSFALENSTTSNSAIKGIDILGRLFKDLPQSMITSTPAFAQKNLLRDKVHQMFISRRKFNPVKDMRISTDVLRDMKEQAQIYKYQVKKRNESLSSSDKTNLDDLIRSQANSALGRLELYGGTMSGWYFRDRSNYYGLLNQVKEDLIKEGRTVFWKPQRFMNPSKAWNKWHGAVAKTEEINRLHEFREVYKLEKAKWTKKLKEDNPNMSSKDIEIEANHEANIRAAFEAKDLMDFTVSGHMMANVNRLFMFLNPALQGWNRAIKTFKPENPKAWGSIALRLAVYSAIPTIMERLYNAYNEDEDELQEMPAYQRDLFWNFKIGANTWFRAPKPFEFGMVSSMTSRLYDYQVNGDPNAWDGVDESLKNMFVPVDGSSLLDNPFVQLYTGRDEFLDKDIVPYYEQPLDLEFRRPKFSSELGKKIHDIGLMDARKFDHFMKKTFSSWGNLMLNATDNIIGDGELKPLFSQRDIGVASESPLHNSRSYKAVKDMQQEKGVSYKHEDLKKLNELRSKYNDATSNDDKDRISEQFRGEAKRIRDKWDSIIEANGDLSSIGGKPIDGGSDDSKPKTSNKFNRGGSKRDKFKRNKK